MSSIINQMFINTAIIVCFLTFGNIFMREKGINPSSPLVRKVFIGFVSGILGCLLMIYSIHFTSKIIVDFRYIPIIIMAFYASWESAIVTAFIVGVFRIINFGLGKASIVAFIVVIVFAVIVSFISRLKLRSWAKWIIALLCLYLVAGAGFFVLLKDSDILGKILTSFYIGTAFVAFMMYFLSEYIQSTNQLYRQMKVDVKKDFLTGLNNVRQFDMTLNLSINNAKERNEMLSILLIDIDFFKKVNDTYGHAEGNMVLKELGHLLVESCRSSDIISRNGGEEFSVILNDCKLERAIEAAERIRKNVEQHEFILSTGKKIKITVSIGVSTFPETTDIIDKLVEQADIALYNAKRSGRNIVSAMK